MKINCSVTNCSHNKDYTCFANMINVGGKSAQNSVDTCCASFLDSATYGHLTNNINHEGYECDAISCNVSSCTYNSNSLCYADSIEVEGDNVNIYTQTNCATFRED